MFFGGEFPTLVFRTSASETLMSRNGAKRLSYAVLRTVYHETTTGS
jgi:hypothetical protein